MSTHNIGFYEEMAKIIIKYHQIRTLSVPLLQGVGFCLKAASFCVTSTTTKSKYSVVTLNWKIRLVIVTRL